MNSRPIMTVVLLGSSILCGQVMIPGKVPEGLSPADTAALDLRESHSSLPCAVKPVRPKLGFDLVFEVGYTVRVRHSDLAGDGGVLTAIFRVTPDIHPNAPVYFEQKWTVPPLDQNSDASALLEGSFGVSEGGYRVDWLMRDHTERVCSAHWKISVRIPAKQARDALAAAGVSTGSVLPSVSEGSLDAPKHLTDAPEGSLRVSVLVNISPETVGGATITPLERTVLFSILRSVAIDTRIADLSITAFNLAKTKVIFRSESRRNVDFAGLRNAIDSIRLGTVSISELASEDGEARFFSELAAEQTGENAPDALIIVGPKSSSSGMPRDLLLEQLGAARCPVFYLTYSIVGDSHPWHDLIGNAVRSWRGQEFCINRPLDLLNAWSRIMSQLRKSDVQ